MKHLFWLAIVFAFITSCTTSYDYLLETESFDTYGGWKLDGQFTQQMGSPYLLAHGLGKPVSDAQTLLKVKENKDYKVWVRTMNWSPGKWDAPGRFRLIIDKDTLPEILGTNLNWSWVFAGEYHASKSEIEVRLHDLTGFDGRCDAIYFSTSGENPPKIEDEQKNWRKQFSDKMTVEQQSFDVVIIGGGVAGCAAAISAAQENLKVALVNNRPILGGNASAEIRVHTEGIHGHYEDILSQIDTKHWPNGSELSKKDDLKRMANIMKYENIHCFLSAEAYDVKMDGNKIHSVEIRSLKTGENKSLVSPYFVDATGDGWIGYWAGNPYSYGRDGATNSTIDESNEQLTKNQHLWFPKDADNRVMGSSVLWQTKKVDHKVNFPDVPWAMSVSKDLSVTHGTWNWEYSTDSLDQINDGEKIRDHMLKAIYGTFYTAKKKIENRNLELTWVGYNLGKRESRRLKGLYTLTFEDIKSYKHFDDAIAFETRPVDVHYQQCLINSAIPDFLSEAIFYGNWNRDAKKYEIPLRSLCALKVPNLMMIGRCFSCTHVALGGPRVMNTTGQMGVAAGKAVTLCKKKEINPCDIYPSHIDELKKLLKL